MKKIEAIIRRTKFEEVKDALLEADIEWFSYYNVRGIGRQFRPFLSQLRLVKLAMDGFLLFR